MMHILIVEDENAAARRLEKLLHEVLTDELKVDRTDSIESTLTWLQEQPSPDLILLDIHLADGSSFEIFEHTDVVCPVVFTTAYDEYAIQAFKHNTVDYLLKPIKVNELKAAIEKYNKRFRPAPTDYTALLDSMKQQDNTNKYLRRLLIRFSNSYKLVDIKDVSYFYTKDKITFVVIRSTGKKYPLDQPLEKLEGQLDPEIFFRINRQFIIHLTSIKELHTYSKSRIKVDLDPVSPQDIIVSTERAAEFKRWLSGD